MTSALPPEILTRLERGGVAAVLVIDDATQAVPVARALLAGGIDVIELTLRTPCALEALRRIRAEVPEMLAGVGTVIQPRQVAEVAAAGAAFAVAPGTNPRVIAAAREQGLPFLPGVATPSDIEIACELGCRELKFFPAEPSGGLSYLRNMAAPYAHLGLRFVPLGGLSARSLPDYIKDPMILAVGGSWIATRALIQDRAWAEIQARASESRRIIAAARPPVSTVPPSLSAVRPGIGHDGAPILASDI